MTQFKINKQKYTLREVCAKGWSQVPYKTAYHRIFYDGWDKNRAILTPAHESDRANPVEILALWLTGKYESYQILADILHVPRNHIAHVIRSSA